MNTEKLYSRVLEILMARYDSPSMPQASEITIDSSLSEDLGMESLDIVDFITGCETAFDIKLDMADAKNVHTIRDLIDFILEVKPSLCNQL